MMFVGCIMTLGYLICSEPSVPSKDGTGRYQRPHHARIRLWIEILFKDYAMKHMKVDLTKNEVGKKTGGHAK